MGVAYSAVPQGDVEKVKELLRVKPSMAALEDKDGATPLMFASNKGHKDVRVGGAVCDWFMVIVWGVWFQVCEVLLEAKAEVNTKDKKYGWTALMHATHYK